MRKLVIALILAGLMLVATLGTAFAQAHQCNDGSLPPLDPACNPGGDADRDFDFDAEEPGAGDPFDPTQ